eukprot:73476-Pleurochrysis_carterae.AAC.1
MGGAQARAGAGLCKLAGALEGAHPAAASAAGGRTVRSNGVIVGASVARLEEEHAEEKVEEERHTDRSDERRLVTYRIVALAVKYRE